MLPKMKHEHSSNNRRKHTLFISLRCIATYLRIYRYGSALMGAKHRQTYIDLLRGTLFSLAWLVAEGNLCEL
jgi:hypothetical protein